MKIHLIQWSLNKAIPFYKLETDTYFTLIPPNEGEVAPVYLKKDAVGAIDWPFSHHMTNEIMYMYDLLLVYPIDPSSEAYKNYTRTKDVKIGHYKKEYVFNEDE